MTNTVELKCKDKVKAHLESRVETIRKLWELYKTDPEANDEIDGNFNEYGLCFDYVAPGTFSDQRRGYFRYQLSWGGPSDEFRFYCTEGYRIDRIEYWFLDWFDGAKKILHGKNLELLTEIFDDFKDMGLLESKYNEAMEQ